MTAPSLSERLREEARLIQYGERACVPGLLHEAAIVAERDAYQCGLLVEWYVRANDGEDHAAPPEHILRGLIRVADERAAEIARLESLLESAAVRLAKDAPFMGER